MSPPAMITLDANEAVASVAHRLNDVIVIYPITPSSAMGEWCDEWSAHGRTNLWGTVPDVVEMQSEAGAIGAVHGALQAGSLATTFTASQGLLLMIPNMYKIAGELTSFAMHVAARTVATHALSIFGDHSDVMAVRQTGFALLCAGSVQEANDFACIAQAATLAGRVPFLHFFDGFRTSHEVAKIAPLSDEDLRAMVDEAGMAAHRRRALTPDHPAMRGTAQNPDTYFQAREACNPYYLALPEVVQRTFDAFAARTGRAYRLFDYHGHPEAEHVLVLMGSGAETARETVDHLNARGARAGVVAVRLYRPFSVADFAAALPPTTRAIAVLDRTKEPGAVGEPLYVDVVTALHEAAAGGQLATAGLPRVIGGRYGLSSKEFTPAMVKAVLDELGAAAPRNHFTVGIVDDVTHTSLAVDPDFDVEPDDVVRAVFFGLGADGTVGANKNSIKIIGEETPNHAQGYFVYDSKKSGAMTISHLRFGPRPIRAPYLVREAHFVACHQFYFLQKHDVLAFARAGGVFLLNAPYGRDAVWDQLPREVQAEIIARRLRFFVIDAQQVARDTGMGTRINTIMQTCFFAVSGVLPRDEAIGHIKHAIEKTYGKKGEELVRRNFAAVDHTLAHLYEVAVPAEATATRARQPMVAAGAPDFVQRVTAVMLAGHGDRLPVSAFPVDGTWPTGTSRWEKRTIADAVPLWDPGVCIQCNKCAMVCPHSAIRAKVYAPEHLDAAPITFQSTPYRGPGFDGWRYTIQVAPQDCTGCHLCVEVCPAKDKSNPRHKAINMAPLAPVLDAEAANFGFFLGLPDPPRDRIARLDVKNSQLLVPLFEYSGACAGCGETPYLKLLTQIVGDRLIIANATGCSSIYGGNLPTTPYTVDDAGRGPAWSNSLFEDNAEFGLGMRLAVDSLRAQAEGLVRRLAGPLGGVLADALLAADQSAEPGIEAQRARVAALRQRLADIDDPDARRLERVADYLVDKAVWLVGGDGWAYDIGFGGLDHVLSLGRRIQILVLDTEVYSNTGGQASKSTPLGAAAKFASSGKAVGKKDLGLMAMSYGHVYVASVAFGAKDLHTVQAFQEASSYDGPSLIIAYSHCIAHGYDLRFGAEQQKLAVNSGIWPLYRYDPRRVERGEPPLIIDAPPGRASVAEYMRNETRFRMVERIDPVRFRWLARAAQAHTARRIALYEQMSHIVLPRPSAAADPTAEATPAVPAPAAGGPARETPS
ncbi:pyruvate:ferredoxin (flavodoxin) oxidoreductase [bacterium]|nr:pyruvate:ferredoxin (flavodoxin) oxidoreductase [Chloroflexi bacterium CFX6]RIL11154.1 MAG: pyruvate:ferredoxin (flavodoxin) oxidoreductase [bacterium]